MILVEDWAEIRRLHRAEQMPIRAIARHLGISVKRALATDRPPKYERPPKGSVVDAVEVQIRELLRETPTMPATVIAERIGWDRGMTILKDRIRELRPAYVPVDPVSRTVYRPGELAQCDLWFPEADIPLGYGQNGRPPVLVMVSGYSRMLPSKRTGDLIDGHWRLLSEWGEVPKLLVWDNEAGVGRGKVTGEFAAFAGLLATKIYLCRPRDPEAKGLVERANGYLETSFLPGRHFAGPDDFNSQLAAWLKVANRRVHRTLGARPPDRWEADRAGMLTLPPVDPPAWWRFQVRLGRTTTSASTPATTPSTPPRSATRSPCCVTTTRSSCWPPGARSSPSMPAAGPDTRPSPTPSTPRPGRQCGTKHAVGPRARSMPSAPARWSRSNSASSVPMTGCSPSSTAARRPADAPRRQHLHRRRQ